VETITSPGIGIACIKSAEKPLAVYSMAENGMRGQKNR